MVGWWAEGLNFQCRGPGARWGGGVGELCVCGPRVTSGARARCGMACSGVACLQPLSVLWGSRGNGGTVGTLAADVEGAQWLALRRKGLMYWGGGGGEASPDVSHECTRPPKGGTQKSFFMVTGMFLHHSFQIKMRGYRRLCDVVVDSDGYLLFNEATQM